MGEEQAVEIEMEDSVEGHEYDMLDGDEDGEDIRDVEVQDAQTTILHPDSIAPQVSFTHSSESSTSVAEITSLVTPAPSTYGASRQSPALTHDSTTDQPPHTQENVESFEHIESLGVVLTQSTPEVPAEVPGPAIEQAQVSVELDHRGAPAGSHMAAEAAQGDVRHAAEPEPSDRAASPPPSEAVHTSVSTGIDEAQETHIGPERTDDVVSEIAPADPHHSHEGAAEEGSNPHEISEGVYIEPPPGVILEVPSSQHSYSLFNRPSYSGRTTPSREEADASADSVVLLHDRPTLFYEPIFSVFEALREEEPFHSSPDLRELELMFSFPSLKLVISEVRAPLVDVGNWLTKFAGQRLRS